MHAQHSNGPTRLYFHDTIRFVHVLLRSSAIFILRVPRWNQKENVYLPYEVVISEICPNNKLNCVGQSWMDRLSNRPSRVHLTGLRQCFHSFWMKLMHKAYDEKLSWTSISFNHLLFVFSRRYCYPCVRVLERLTLKSFWRKPRAHFSKLIYSEFYLHTIG